jgi:hypothetical protein
MLCVLMHDPYGPRAQCLLHPPKIHEGIRIQRPIIPASQERVPVPRRHRCTRSADSDSRKAQAAIRTGLTIIAGYQMLLPPLRLSAWDGVVRTPCEQAQIPVVRANRIAAATPARAVRDCPGRTPATPTVAALADVLLNEREVGHRNGFVIATSLSEGCGVIADSAPEVFQRNDKLVRLEIQVGSAHMDGMPEFARWQLAHLKRLKELLVVHAFSFRR